MLVTTIEVWPRGKKRKRSIIATIYVANIKQEGDVADYEILIKYSNGFLECKKLEEYVKGDGAIKLIARAIENSKSIKFDSSFIHAINQAEREN